MAIRARAEAPSDLMNRSTGRRGWPDVVVAALRWRLAAVFLRSDPSDNVSDRQSGACGGSCRACNCRELLLVGERDHGGSFSGSVSGS